MEYKYTNEKGEVEIIEKEKWCWGAIFEDGSELRQFDDKGIFHRVGEIDQSKLSMFVLYKDGDESKRIDMPFQKGMKLIYKYRNIRPYYLDHFVKVYILGYKFESRYAFNFILPDGRRIISPLDNTDLAKFNVK